MSTYPPIQKLGDRHLRSFDGRFSETADNDGIVLVSAEETFATSTAGQHLLFMLVNLLARQYGVVREIQIAVAKVDVLSQAALLAITSPKLPDALIELAAQVSGEAAIVSLVSVPVVKGGVHLSFGGNTVAAFADGWRLSVGDPAILPRVTAESALAFGPFFAASILAGECFKTFFGFKEPQRTRLPLHFSLWSFEAGESWGELDPGRAITTSLPPFYLVGCGAVGQAFLGSLVASAVTLEHVTLIDHDTIDEELTNLNRYCLAVLSDANAKKVVLAEAYLQERSVSCFAFQGRWEDYQASSREGQRSDLSEREQTFHYEYIISCVDKNPARHAIQRFWPRVLFGGSTLGLGATVQSYDMASQFDCLMCANSISSDDWSIELQAERLRVMTSQERRELFKTVDADIEAVEDYLRNPRCGTLGERELFKFRTSADSTEASVGFVSVGAGVVLGAAWVVAVVTGAAVDCRGNARRFSFETVSGRITAHRRRTDCECVTRGRIAYDRKWLGRDNS